MPRLLRPALPRQDLEPDLGQVAGVSPRLGRLSAARTHALALVALTWAGFGLRLVLVDAFPLREDEAIYGFWARTASVDPWFLHVWPDKPPLFIWLLQGAFALLGPSAAAARMVSIMAGTLAIPLVAWGAHTLWQSRVAALLAALLLTFNPYAVSFAPTAYTDTVLALCGIAAVIFALRGRGLVAGLLLGVACMTKQQGVLYVPLVVGLLACAPLGALFADYRARFTGTRPAGQGWQPLAWAICGAALVILPMLWWDSRRWAVAPSPWALAQQTYAPLTWLPPQQWGARVEAWAVWLWYLGGSAAVWVMLAVALTGALVVAARRPRVALLVGWGLAFAALHIVTSVQVWDRYLLPLAGWLALVASGPLAMAVAHQGHRRRPEWVRGLCFLLLLIGMAETIVPGVDAAKGRFPIGGDHGDYAGLSEAIAWVQAQESRAILYHQVLGWHLRFYLYDALQPHGDDPPRYDLRWFPSTPYLADNASKTPYPPKYLIVPEWATPRDLALHLTMRGLALEPRLHVGRFAVMEIVQPPRPACDWCMSAVPRFPLRIAPSVQAWLDAPPMSKPALTPSITP